MSLLHWLLRIRHRRGYGIHSPWAFGLVTEVIYERWPYYAYAKLPILKGWKQHRLQLLFRLANHFQPSRVDMIGMTPDVGCYLSAGCSSATINTMAADEHPTRIIMYRPDGKRCEIIFSLKSAYWHHLWSASQSVNFDLRHMGIAYYGIPILPQNYVVNDEW